MTRKNLMITAEERGGHIDVLVAGEVNSHTSPQLEEELSRLVEDPSARLALGLGNVTLMTSAGLRVLLVIARHLNGRGCLVLYDCQSKVREVLGITGFDSILTVCDTYEAAVSVLAETPGAVASGRQSTAILR